jgi:hypothetical protein
MNGAGELLTMLGSEVGCFASAGSARYGGFGDRDGCAADLGAGAALCYIERTAEHLDGVHAPRACGYADRARAR